MMKNILKLWDRFLFSRFDPLSVSFFRISLGLLMFVMFIANYPNWERFYGSDGIISLNDMDLPKRIQDWWCAFYWTEGKIPIIVYWWIGIISTITFTIGWQTRISTIILYVLQTSMIHRNLLIVNGDDLVFRMLLFYSCFAPLNHCLSVDSWLSKRKSGGLGTKELPLIWPVRLMQINIALIYVISLPYKVFDDPAWLNGEAIYWTVTSSMWSQCPFPELFYKCDCLLSKIFTWGTILIEGSFPILVWFEKTKLIVVALVTSLHLGIAFMVPNVAFFTLSMVCSFWVFVPGEMLREFFSKKVGKYFSRFSH